MTLRPRTRSMLVACAITFGALPRGESAAPARQPEGWRDGMRLREAVDVNPDPHIVEVALDARVEPVEIVPGHPTPVWTYDGGLPGPLIRARVGDRVIVHFTNRLPQATTVHWHGVRVPIEMDGVPDISQPPVEPGGDFTYDFVVPDAGLFWYHPHVMSAAQVGFGLYGALLVDDPSENVGVSDELVMVLSDISLEAGGAMESPESGGPAGMVFGREGNHVLVNGRERSVLHARSGVPQRWRVVNAAKSRYFSFDAEDTSFIVIGGDGGLQELPTPTKDLVVLAPGERLDLIVTPRARPGSEVIVRSALVDRGFGSTEYREVPELFTMSMTAERAAPEMPMPGIRRAIEPLSAAAATEVNLRLTLAETANRGYEYGINGLPFPKAPPIAAKPGETQLWTVFNDTKWAHPLHLHGFFFQVVDAARNPMRPLAWKDTVNVPANGTVRLLVRFDGREGEWMYHCHILDHADGGLMSTVVLGSAKSRGHTHRDR